MIENNQVTKYFFYAMGEIILVVIGILIALQVNNWNEQKRQEQKIEVLINNLKEDLQENILDANRVINWNIERDSLMRFVLSREVTKEDYISNDLLSGLLRNYNIPLIAANSLPSLLETEDLGNTYSNLKERLNLYKYVLEEEKELFTLIKQQVYDEIQLGASLDFDQTGPESLDDRINYYLTDQSYYNRLFNFKTTLIGNYNRRLIARRNVEVGLLYTINAIQGNASINDSNQWFQDLGMQPFTTIACNQTTFEIPAQTNYRNSFLFANTTNEDVYVDQLGVNGEVIKSLKIEPKSFITSYLIGLDNQYIGTAFQISNNQGCVNAYTAVKHGYLLIE